jgi:hypothetical protein
MEILKVFGSPRDIYYAVLLLEENKDKFFGKKIDNNLMCEIYHFINDNVIKHKLEDVEGYSWAQKEHIIGVCISQDGSIVNIDECDAYGNRIRINNKDNLH